MTQVPLIEGVNGVLGYIHRLRSGFGFTEYDLEKYKANLQKNVKFFRRKLELKTFAINEELEKHKTGNNFLIVISLIISLSELRLSDSVVNLKNDLTKGTKRNKSFRKNKKSISFLNSLKNSVSSSQIAIQTGFNKILCLLGNKKYSETGSLLEKLNELLNVEKSNLSTETFLYYNNLIKESQIRLSNKSHITETKSANKSIENLESSYNEIQTNLTILREKLNNKQSVNNEILFINNNLSSLLEVIEPILYDKKTTLGVNVKNRLDKEVKYLKFLRLVNISLETNIKLNADFDSLFDKVYKQEDIEEKYVLEIVNMGNKLFNNIKDSYLDSDLSNYMREEGVSTEDINTSFIGNKNSYNWLLNNVLGVNDDGNKGDIDDINIGDIYGIPKESYLRNYVTDNILSCNFYKEIANSLLLFKNKSYKEAISEINILLEEDSFDEKKKGKILTIKRYILKIFCKERVLDVNFDQPIVFNQLFNKCRKKLKVVSKVGTVKENKEEGQVDATNKQKKWYKFW